jgi:hypothetical protein
VHTPQVQLSFARGPSGQRSAVFNMFKTNIVVAFVVLLLVAALENADGSSGRRRRPRFSTMYAAEVQEQLVWECAVADRVMILEPNGDGMVAAAAAAQGGVEPARVFAASSAMTTAGVQVGHAQRIHVLNAVLSKQQVQQPVQ